MIKKLWYYGREDSLIRDSLLLFSATLIVNFGAFLYHFVMGRLLGVANYGVLGTLLTILYIINVPVNVIQTTITKFVVNYKALKEEEKINFLIRRSFRRLFILGIVGVIIVNIISSVIANFLHISRLNVIIISPIILFALLLPIVRGNLQGLQKFQLLGLNLIFEIIIKLGLGVTLVYIGYRINGAIFAIVLSFLFPILFGLISIRQYIKKKQVESFDNKKVYKYTYPVLIALTLMTFLFTIDVFLVKHLFDDLTAGLYVAAAIIGKIIFFGTFAISQVMFPKSVERHSLNQSTKKILKKSLLLVAIIAIPITLFYFLFPEFVTIVLFGKNYLGITNLLGLFGVAISLFSFSYLLVLYNLSINRTKLIYFLVFAAILETVLIYLMHDSLFQVLLILTGIMTMVFLFVLSYTLVDKRWLNFR